MIKNYRESPVKFDAENCEENSVRVYTLKMSTKFSKDYISKTSNHSATICVHTFSTKFRKDKDLHFKIQNKSQ